MEQTIQHTLFAAVRHLSAMNGGGFSSDDIWMSYALARKPEEQWSPVEKRIAYDRLWNYADKLSVAGISYSRIPTPPQMDSRVIERYLAGTRPPVTANVPLKGVTVGSTKIEKKVDFVRGVFQVTFPWNASLVARMKQIPTHKWRPELGKIWTLNATSTMAGPLQQLITDFGFTVTPNAENALRFIKEQPSLKEQTHSRSVGIVGYSKDKSTLAFDARMQSMAIREALKDMGGKWSKAAGQWTLPLDALEELVDTFPTVTVLPELNRLLARQTIEYPPVEMPDLTGLIAGRTLYKHQQEGIAFLVKERYALLGDDPGLGKTVQALLAAKILSQGKTQILVLCPASLQENWQIEADMVAVPIQIYSWGATSLPSPTEEFILICDESHYGSNDESQRSRRFNALAALEACVSCICLTGTPLNNGRPEELFPMLKAIKHPLGRRRKFYKERYCAGEDRASNLDELHKRITKTNPQDPLSKAVMLRREKAILGLPPKTRHLITVKMSPEATRVYQEKFLEMQKAYREKSNNGSVGTADAIVMVNHLRHAGSLGKVEAACEYARKALAAGEQVVLFTEFKEPARRIAAALMGGVISGDTSNSAIQELKAKFQRGSLKVLVCTFKRGGVGHTLTAGSTCIQVDRPWTSGGSEQATDRLHRIGQTQPVKELWLRATQTDVNIDELISIKSMRISLVLAGKRKTMRGTGNMNDVIKEMASMLFS